MVSVISVIKKREREREPVKSINQHNLAVKASTRKSGYLTEISALAV